MHQITVEGFDEDYDHDETFPNFIVCGENEMQAVEIFCILYNANILTALTPCENGAITNCSVGGTYAATFVVNMANFKELFSYFQEVHGVKLKMEVFE